MKVSVGIGNGQTLCKVCHKFIRAGQRILVITHYDRSTPTDYTHATTVIQNVPMIYPVGTNKKPYSPTMHIHSDPEDCDDNRMAHPTRLSIGDNVENKKINPARLVRRKQIKRKEWPRKLVPVNAV